MTSWEDVAVKVKDTLKSSISYSDIEVIVSIPDYITKQVSQARMNKDFLILLSHPEDNSEDAESLIGGLFRRKYEIEIAVVSKTSPTGLTRIQGAAKKSVSDVRGDVVTALEHKNLGGFVDNKAHRNFEVGWNLLPQDDKSITIYSTIYTVIKTER